MPYARGLLSVTIAVAAGLSVASTAGAQESIKVGNTMPYSGPGAAYGEIGTTLKAYFQKVNDGGGINGRKIEFISYDDAYTPAKTVDAVRRLVERDKVLMLVGTFGSPQNAAIHKYVNQRKVPHLFLGSTANGWDDPENYPWTVGWQPNATIEGRVYGEYVAKYHPDKKIAILSQNDDYGRSFMGGLDEGLGDKKANIVARATYEAADPTVDSQIANLHGSGAGVFLDFSTPKFAALAIRKVADLGWKPVHIIPTAAASVSQVLKPAGFENSQGIITAAYLKDPTDPRWANDPGMNDFRSFLDKYAPGANKSSVYAVIGYSWGQATEHVIKAAGNDVTNTGIMRAATHLDHVPLPLLLPGITLDNSPKHHQPINSLQLTRFQGEALVAYDPAKDK